MQELRIAGKAASGATLGRWREAAFVGWQVRSAVTGALGAKGGAVPFGRYLKTLGLDDSVRVEYTKGRAERNAERVREAFKRGGVARSE